jgi:hypothetical protein
MIWGEGVSTLVTTGGGAGFDYKTSNTIRTAGMIEDEGGTER